MCGIDFAHIWRIVLFPCTELNSQTAKGSLYIAVFQPNSGGRVKSNEILVPLRIKNFIKDFDSINVNKDLMLIMGQLRESSWVD